jgi:hypothetical protein
MILAAKDGDLVRLKKSLFVLSPLEAQDAYMDTPLHHAAVRGHLEACVMLLRCEPSLIKAVTKEEYERRLRLLLNACSRCESSSDDGDEDELDETDESASQGSEGMEGMLESLLPELSPSLLCPITHALLVDPVTTCDHHVYERYAITQGLERH